MLPRTRNRSSLAVSYSSWRYSRRRNCRRWNLPRVSPSTVRKMQDEDCGSDWCKDNTSQDHFRRVNLHKEFAYSSEIELIGTATTIELVTRSAERKSQQCVKWPETLGKSVSVVDANAWVIISLLCCHLVSSSLDCFPCLDARTLWLKFESPFIPWSSSCFMRIVSVASDLFDLSFNFISFLIISLITLLFLLPDIFNFLNVVDKYPAYFRWGPWHPDRERASHNWKTRANSSNSHLIKFCRLCSHFETMNQESLLWCLPTWTTYCMAISLWELKSRTVCCNSSGKKERGIFRFCGKEFRQDEDFGIHVTAKDNTERVQPIIYDVKHGLTRRATAEEVHQVRFVTRSLDWIARQNTTWSLILYLKDSKHVWNSLCSRLAWLQ